MDKKTIHLTGLITLLKKKRKEVGGLAPVYIGIPFRNGIGLHYEGIKNVSTHEGMIDIFTTVPDNDDTEKPAFS